jgi:hypothetical protein
MGAEVDDTTMADLRQLAARWNADPKMQKLLPDCGVGFADSEAADPAPALRRAAEKALARHGRVERHVLSGWSVGTAAFMATADGRARLVSKRRLVFLAAVACALSVTVGVAAPPASRVLVPRTADELSRAFALMRPEWRLSHASIEKDHVDATLCFSAQGPSGCTAILLTDPTAGCAGEWSDRGA